MKIYALFDPKGNIVDVSKDKEDLRNRAWYLQDEEVKQDGCWETDETQNIRMKELGWVVRRVKLV